MPVECMNTGRLRQSGAKVAHCDPSKMTTCMRRHDNRAGAASQRICDDLMCPCDGGGRIVEYVAHRFSAKRAGGEGQVRAVVERAAVSDDAARVDDDHEGGLSGGVARRDVAAVVE